MYHYRECGLNNVYLNNGYTLTIDPEYGKCISFVDLTGLHRAIAMNLVQHKPRLSGAELRFLRKEMGLSQHALADLLGNNEQAVARWEKTGKVPKWADRFTRIFVKDHYGEQYGVRKLIERVRELDNVRAGRLLLEANGDHWRVAA
jgi:DNA-binding XRE family transcriptional regulator